MNTLYVADLDGTLLGDDGKLSQFTITTLNALTEHGLPFTINTSRTPKSVMPVIEGLKLKLDAILMNGSLFYNTETGEHTDPVLLPKSAAAAALTACDDYFCEPFVFELADGDVSVMYCRATLPQSAKFMRDRAEYYREFKQVPKAFLAREAAYIVCADKTEKLARLKAVLDKSVDISCSLFYDDNDENALLEIYAAAAGKKNATERFMNKHGFERVVAFGDNLNDTEMLAFADLGLAVANAKTAAKRAADEIIESNTRDGVAKWLLLEWARRPELY